MKTNVLLFIAIVLFATSCSNKYSLVKRKYNKGFYVSVNKKAAAPKVSEKVIVKEVAGEQVAVEVVPARINNDIKTTTPALETTVPLNKTTAKSYAVTKNPTIPLLAEANNTPVAFEAKKSIKPVPAAASKMGAESDVNMVLLVILAILIPPLAVYLKNRTIDQWFWITLILTVLAYGLIFGAYGWGGLFGLAAVVIALLYVFDAIK